MPDDNDKSRSRLFRVKSSSRPWRNGPTVGRPWPKTGPNWPSFGPNWPKNGPPWPISAPNWRSSAPSWPKAAPQLAPSWQRTELAKNAPSWPKRTELADGRTQLAGKRTRARRDRTNWPIGPTGREPHPGGKDRLERTNLAKPARSWPKTAPTRAKGAHRPGYHQADGAWPTAAPIWPRNAPTWPSPGPTGPSPAPNGPRCATSWRKSAPA